MISLPRRSTLQEDEVFIQPHSKFGTIILNSLTQMEEEIRKGRKPAKGLTSERFRYFVYFVAILSMLSCIVFLSVSLVSMQRRMSLLESKLSEISEELKQVQSKSDAKESISAVHMRHERNANPTTTLADLTKRIIALEGRSTLRGQKTVISLLMTVFHASLPLLIINFIITLLR